MCIGGCGETQCMSSNNQYAYTYCLDSVFNTLSCIAAVAKSMILHQVWAVHVPRARVCKRNERNSTVFTVQHCFLSTTVKR